MTTSRPRATSSRTKRARTISGAKKPTAETAAKRIRVMCFSDFDGTIFLQDTGHVLFDLYGCGARRRKVLDEQIKSGKRSFKVASEEMWGSLRVPFDAAVQTLKRSLKIDKDFVAFHKFCSENQVPFSVISAGLRPVLKEVLKNSLGEEKASHIDIVSNDATIKEDGSAWKPIWRHDSKLGHDKAVSIDKARQKARSESQDRVQPLILFIGDGVSDLPAAHAADVLFARKGLQLEKYCIEHNIAYVPFDTFADIQEVLNFILKDICRESGASGDSGPAKLRRRVSRGNKVSFAVARAQCQTMVRTPKEAAAPAA